MLPDFGNHPGFILAAYAISFLVVAAMIGWVVLDNRRQRTVLAELEARGLRRRSAAKDTKA